MRRELYIILLTAMIVKIAGTDLTPPSYPSVSSPASVSDGNGCSFTDVVTGIIINDSSTNGWTLTITSANGSATQPKLLNSVNNAAMDYDLEINNVSGTLATGLALYPAVNSILIFSGNSAVISPTGTATGSTIDFQCDLRMRILDSSTNGKLAGNYTDTINLLLSSDD